MLTILLKGNTHAYTEKKTHRNSYNLERKAVCVYLVLTVLVTVSGTVRDY